MATKTLCILDSTDHRKPTPSTIQVMDHEIHLEGFRETLIPPAIGQQWHHKLEHDYQIALVPRREYMPSTEMPNPSAIAEVFLLPLTWQQLLCRVRGELQSDHLLNSSKWSRFGDVRVNFETMQVMRCDRPVQMTAQQFKLLKFLMQSPERVFSRDELLQEVWGYYHYPTTRTVDNHICFLRRKLELTPDRPIHFLTVHGIGYKFVP